MKNKLAIPILIILILLIGCKREKSKENLVTEDVSIVILEDNDLFTKDVEDLTLLHEINHEYIRVEPSQLRNVMPNSWQKLTRLTAEEEQNFIQTNINVFAKIQRDLQNHDYPYKWFEKSENEYYLIYKQQVGADIFYRILITLTKTPAFLSRDVQFVQYIVYQGNISAGSLYNFLLYTVNEPIGIYSSIDIITDNDKALGVLLTSLNTLKDGDNPREWSRQALRNGQLYGYSHSFFYTLEEALKIDNEEKISGINITASDCLVDPDIPLRYSLQNAFDKDPSTAYVENTEDDLIRITFNEFVEKVAIINGYATNINLYYANNRVKTIARDKTGMLPDGRHGIIQGDTFDLNDSTLTYQYINVVECEFLWVTDIFNGNIYNDTCIAELNFMIDGKWLFGDMNE